jgi:phosphatidate cytidylyltransferase
MLRDRVITAVVLVAFFLTALFALPPYGWTSFAVLVLAAAAWEWAGFALLGQAGRVLYTTLTAAVGAGMAYGAGLASGSVNAPILIAFYAVALLFWIICAPLWLIRRPAHASRSLILVFGWIVLLPTFLALIQLRNIQPATLLAFMVVVWIADIAAYFAGRRFGRHKLAPEVSPGKTWEGLYGALAAAAMYALAWGALFRGYGPAAFRDLPVSPAWLVALVIFLVFLSVIGDLFESAMKRRAGLKDSGQLLPGHGGVLDRIDALTSVLPAAALVSSL